jgi:hypothetical protein
MVGAGGGEVSGGARAGGSIAAMGTLPSLALSSLPSLALSSLPTLALSSGVDMLGG